MQPQTTPTPSPEQLTGMWAPYEPPEIGERLEELAKVGPFVLVEVQIREDIPTKHGPKDAVDLRVATIDAKFTRLFSGFPKALVGQCRRIEPGNLPAVCRLVPKTTPNGVSQELQLVQLLPAGADVCAVARAQPVPLTPGADPDIPL